MKQSLALIDDLIELEKVRDAQFKKMAVLAHKHAQITGESSLLHYLKNLKELVEIEFKQATNPAIVPPSLPDYPSAVFEDGKPHNIDNHPDCKLKPFEL